MAKAAKEIQMENPKELETQSAGTTCSPSEEQAEKPSMLCFKKRTKSCKKGLAMKDACEGASAASEEKSQCTDQGEAKVSAQPRSSRGAWAAIKSLTRPRRRQKSSSRKKVPSDSQVQLEIDAEEGCTQGFPRKKASSGVKMPCIRFSRGKKKRSPSEGVEESEGSVQANEEMGIFNKAIEEPEDLASAEEPSKAEPSSPLPVKVDQEDKGTVEEGADAGRKSEPSAEPGPDVDEHAEHTAQSQITSSEAVDEHAEHTTPSEITSSEAVGEHAEHTTPSGITSSEAVEHAERTTPLEITSSVAVDEHAECTTPLEISSEAVGEHAEHTTPSGITSSEAVDEHAEHTTPSEITSSVAVDETIQEQLPKGSPHQTAVHVEEREVPAETPVSTEQPNSTPEITEVQEIANICKELPERDESERNTDLPEECKAEETVMDFSQSAFKDEAASIQSSSSHREKPEVNMGTCVGIVITVTEAVDSDNNDSDQDYEPTLVLHHNKQKGNKKSSGSFDFGQKEGPEAGSSALVEEKGLGDQGHRTSDQYELLLIETASSLVKAAIQSSIEQLVNEMALEQNKHNSFL
ncbi:A-kinase anchor protein 5 isoform X1 [Oxyura jamaicensis]|uniref:A-kinase anchor protein 5 isoform X1 n=1 Tax=Oxyura jamaicensis TaxID=8884 RepID=UPI0015A6E995|nr:A-kinase anchor protein 5 isoform X1 [Oxyura jamaicensis]XP_035183350.1 A-kinase anchor protein 5 isoform X1 [Oxyura jamaicensis]XP_035183351.1 A-kinase anchor protein 5 isoform X1 [Oxyura jamaicensis]XP_035183352.1 A-kinase anchor protein 5 isoform X1 [Oxyura jamaicensis]